jgi:adenylate kinase family enzyme
VENTRIERFKAGRDGGVDGRFFVDIKKEVILQCKHWSNTPLNQLIRELIVTEKPKLDKLKPHRYLLAISNVLSRSDKTKIYNALAPYIALESDIYGREDLNDLLKGNAQIEQKHYKLWLHSSSVLGHIFNNAILGRSAFSLEEIINSSSRYVVTVNHQAALNILAKLGVVIITGEPGVGKTTLADHLCLHYIAQDFSYLKISDDISEAESAFDPDKKQILYFDDFLGRNYLDALRGNEGSHIAQFIRRVVANKNKRFVLTSRSTILNQGKFLIDSLEHTNVKRNEYEIKIQSLTELDKAQILYNHIWHSGLDPSYVEELYVDRRYRKIIDHKNFNPRLISLITDVTRLDACKPADYWRYINESLANPSQVWENPFLAQQDDFARAIILLLVLNGQGISEDVLAEAYHRFIALNENQHLNGRHEFQSNIRLLTGSFLNRVISSHRSSTIDLFNPSIGDYVLRRYADDLVTLRLGLQSLRTFRSTITLLSLQGHGLLSQENAKLICEALFKHFADTNFDGVSASYISSLFDVYKECNGLKNEPSPALQASVLFVLKQTNGVANDDSFSVIEWGLTQHIVTSEEALNFVSLNITQAESASEIKAMSSLLSSISAGTPGFDLNEQAAKDHVLGVLSHCFSEFIDVDAAFSRVDYGDVNAASKELAKLVEDEFAALGVDVCAYDVAQVLESYDVAQGLHKFFENSYDGDDRSEVGPAMHSFDEIDDLFDRGGGESHH